MIDAFLDVAPKALALIVVFGGLYAGVEWNNRRISRDQIRRAFAGRRQPIQFTRAQQLDLERMYLLRSSKSQPVGHASLESAPIAGEAPARTTNHT